MKRIYPIPIYPKQNYVIDTLCLALFIQKSDTTAASFRLCDLLLEILRNREVFPDEGLVVEAVEIIAVLVKEKQTLFTIGQLLIVCLLQAGFIALAIANPVDFDLHPFCQVRQAQVRNEPCIPKLEFTASHRILLPKDEIRNNHNLLFCVKVHLNNGVIINFTPQIALKDNTSTLIPQLKPIAPKNSQAFLPIRPRGHVVLSNICWDLDHPISYLHHFPPVSPCFHLLLFSCLLSFCLWHFPLLLDFAVALTLLRMLG